MYKIKNLINTIYFRSVRKHFLSYIIFHLLASNLFNILAEESVANKSSGDKFSSKSISALLLREFRCQLLCVNSIFSSKRASSHFQLFPEASD